MGNKFKKVGLIIASAVLLLTGAVFFQVNSSSASNANADEWHSNWVAQFDSDYRKFYIDVYTGWPRKRYECTNPYLSGCIVGLANNYVFSSPPTVVGWTNTGSINIGGLISYTEDWLAGDGLGPSLDHYFKQDGVSGNSSNRNHAWGFFTGETKLADSGGGGMNLHYRFIFASDEDTDAFPAE